MVQVDTMAGLDFFAYAAELMTVNPPHITDQPIVARMKRIVVSTYQSVSGYGREAVEVLQKETHTILHGSKFSSDSYPFPHSIAFNIIPQIDDFNEMLRFSRKSSSNDHI